MRIRTASSARIENKGILWDFKRASEKFSVSSNFLQSEMLTDESLALCLVRWQTVWGTRDGMIDSLCVGHWSGTVENSGWLRGL